MVLIGFKPIKADYSVLLDKNCSNLYLNPLGLVRLSKWVLDELSGSKLSWDIANIRYFADSVYLDLILALVIGLGLCTLWNILPHASYNFDFLVSILALIKYNKCSSNS